MDELLYKIVERMLLSQTSLSRNKNFEAYEAPTVKRANRIVRHLRSLRDDLRKYGRDGRVALSTLENGSVEDGGERRELELVVEHLKSRRTSYLSALELNLLRKDPEVDELLKEKLKEAQ